MSFIKKYWLYVSLPAFHLFSRINERLNISNILEEIVIRWNDFTRVLWVDFFNYLKIHFPFEPPILDSLTFSLIMISVSCGALIRRRIVKILPILDLIASSGFFVRIKFYFRLGFLYSLLFSVFAYEAISYAIQDNANNDLPNIIKFIILFIFLFFMFSCMFWISFPRRNTGFITDNIVPNKLRKHAKIGNFYIDELIISASLFLLLTYMLSILLFIYPGLSLSEKALDEYYILAHLIAFGPGVSILLMLVVNYNMAKTILLFIGFFIILDVMLWFIEPIIEYVSSISDRIEEAQ